MSDETVQARFHGGPFDGGSLPVDESDVHDLVAIETTDDGPRLHGPLADDGDHAGRDVYRLSPAASGLEGDVEYAYEAPLDVG